MENISSVMAHATKDNSTLITNSMEVECCITLMENFATQAVGKVTHFMDSVCSTTRNPVTQIRTPTTTISTSVIRTIGNTTKESSIKIRNKASVRYLWSMVTNSVVVSKTI